MAQHAILSASASSRWLECTPSARLEESFFESSSSYADEGTLAHAISELLLRRRLGLVNQKPYEKEFQKLKKSEYYTPEMLEHCDEYATYVIEKFNEAESLIFLEQRVDIADYIIEGFGTSDVIILQGTKLRLIDLKYGKGVAVSAHENKQLQLYALGALKDFDYIEDFTEVELTIYQPRLDSISVFEISVKELVNWGETYVKPRALLAWEGKGEYVAGKHCQFCKAKHECKAFYNFNLQLARMDFEDPVLIDDADISFVLERAAIFKNWLNSIEEYALKQAVDMGKKWPGFKVVEGRSNRKYADEAKVAEVLKTKGYKDDEIFKKTLLGITEMTSFLGKKDFGTYLNEYIVKPPGKPALVPLEDKRPEFNSVQSAIEDFKDDDLI